MQLVEQHVINPNHAAYHLIDDAAFRAKNLYNAANYIVRQTFFATSKTPGYAVLYHQVKTTEAYRDLPAKVAQHVIKGLARDWQNYFAARKTWRKFPAKFLGEPRIPHYKDKADGRGILTYTIQAISRKLLKVGKVSLSGLQGLLITTKQTAINCVRIIPKKHHYVIEIVYTKGIELAALDYGLIAGVDLGLNNLAVIAANKPGFQPVVVNGRPIKSINQFYNKRKAELQSRLQGNKKTSQRIDRSTTKRNRRVNHYLHTASRRIIDFLVQQTIGILVIGKNDGWKQNINIGGRNNQNFVAIPHARFIDMLTYKAELVGINVIITEESYTSKCSLLDLEPICKHDHYAGQRIKRGLFRSATGKLINADLNGAGNILRKVAPAAYSQGVEGVVVHPVPLGIN